jgi:Sec-independent protein translocase protein TatA
VVILIVVGPKRLPEIARKFGRTMENFRRAADEFKDQIMSMDQEPSSPASSNSPPDADGVTPPDGTYAKATPIPTWPKIGKRRAGGELVLRPDCWRPGGGEGVAGRVVCRGAALRRSLRKRSPRRAGHEGRTVLDEA